MTSSSSYMKDLLDVMDLILKDLEKRRKEKEELLRMRITAEWISNVGYSQREVCYNSLCARRVCGPDRCRSPPRCPSPKRPRVVLVDLDVAQEHEVVLQMEGQEMLSSDTDQLEDEESDDDGTSGAPSTVILSDGSDVTHET